MLESGVFFRQFLEVARDNDPVEALSVSPDSIVNDSADMRLDGRLVPHLS
jgi:hypothetical protein